MKKIIHSSDSLNQVIENYWEVFPPLWSLIQAHIRDCTEKQFKITVEQFHILRHIREGRDSVSALAEARDISRPAISQSIELMVTRGLVVRCVDLQDRRHVKLELTADGNTLMDVVFDDTRQWMINLLSPLTPSEIHALTRSMISLKKILKP
jgi:DNA-binding MarR family transcriptional regulator